MSEVRPIYECDLTRAGLPISPAVSRGRWLPSREASEAVTWPLLPLTGHASVPLPPHIVEAASTAARKPANPETTGARALRVAIAESLGEELGRPVDPHRHVLVTSGSMQALVAVTMACCTAARGAVAHAPSFFYADLAEICGVPFRWALGGPATPDWHGFGAALGSDAALAITNTPCNPTGYVFREDDLENLARAVHGADCWVVSDEAYLALIHEDLPHLSPARHPDLADRTLIVRSFSKTYSMAPWRVGFAVGPAPLIAAMAKVAQWMSLGVDAVAQAAVLAALEGPTGWIDAANAELAVRRFGVIDAINATGMFAAGYPESGALAWARATDENADENALGELLGRELGVAAVPGRSFGAETPHLRIPFGGSTEAADELVRRLLAFAPATHVAGGGR